MTSQNNSKAIIIQRSWRTGGVLNYFLAILSFTIILWTIYESVSQIWFGALLYRSFPAFFAGALFINRLLAVLQRFTGKKLWKRLLGLMKWLLTIIFPFFLAGMIIGNADRRVVSYIHSQLEPVISKIDNIMKQKSVPPTEVKDQLSGVTGLRNITYYWGQNLYLIETGGPSIDIDGTTIFYTSVDKKWHRFHNDSLSGDAPPDDEVLFYKKILEGLITTDYYIDQNNNWGQR